MWYVKDLFDAKGINEQKQTKTEYKYIRWNLRKPSFVFRIRVFAFCLFTVVQPKSIPL